MPALGRLKELRGHRWRLLRAALAGRPGRHRETLGRLGLDQPRGLEQKLIARVLAAALDQTGS